MTAARTVADPLAERTTLEVECVDLRWLSTIRTYPRATRLQRTVAAFDRESERPWEGYPLAA